MSIVLILDDDPDLRALLKSALLGQFIRSLEADSVRQAREILRHQKVDAVIVDGLLPDARGLDFIAELRSRDKNTDVIFISSQYQDLKTFRQLTRELQVSLVLYKPFNAMDFALELQQLLAERSTGVEPTTPADLEQDLHEQLLKLSRGYRQRLPQKLSELREVLEAAGADQAKIPLARTLAHRLHGSAGSYGFPELGELVARIENQLSETRVVAPDFQWKPIFTYLEEATLLAQGLQADSETLLPQPSQVPHLLVVDDDQDFLDLLMALNRKLGIPVISAKSPAQALELAERVPLMGAILDVHMGSQLAFELAHRLRDLKGKEELPLAFASVDHCLDIRIAATAAGGTRFFDKPITEESLLGLLQQFVHHSHEAQSRVILLDDDPDIQTSYSSTLRAGKIAVECLSSSENLLERMEAFRPDLVLLDIELPTWSGIEICRALRSSPQWEVLPILLISSQVNVDRRVKAYQAGANDVLTKPLVAEELLARVTVQLERAHLLKDRSDRDALSGLLLRRAFLEASQRAMASCSRAGSSLSVSLLDIDHFKAINDRFGHSVGDQVLASLGDLLRRRFRREDLRCRWGGEEFLLAFPGQTAEFARLASQRLLEEFSALAFLADNGEVFHATFTAGVAAYPHDGDSLLELVRKADEALYTGKRAGRNQVQAARSVRSGQTQFGR